MLARTMQFDVGTKNYVFSFFLTESLEEHSHKSPQQLTLCSFFINVKGNIKNTCGDLSDMLSLTHDAFLPPKIQVMPLCVHQKKAHIQSIALHSQEAALLM